LIPVREITFIRLYIPSVSTRNQLKIQTEKTTTSLHPLFRSIVRNILPQPGTSPHPLAHINTGS